MDSAIYKSVEIDSNIPRKSNDPSNRNLVNIISWNVNGLTQAKLNKDILGSLLLLFFFKQLNSPSEKNRMDYKVYKNILSTCLKDAENSYYINLVNEKQSGTTNFWKAYRATLNSNKRKQQTKLQKLIVDGKTLTDDKDIADGINNYFCTIGIKISSKIKSPGGHFTDYLKNKINKTFFISPVVEAGVSRE